MIRIRYNTIKISANENENICLSKWSSKENENKQGKLNKQIYVFMLCFFIMYAMLRNIAKEIMRGFIQPSLFCHVNARA